jgi:hypothetical protein
MAEASNFPELAKFYQEEVVRRGARMMSSMLERGVARGEFRSIDVPQLTQVLIAPMMMLTTWKHSAVAPCDCGELRPLAFIDAFLDMALHGLLPRAN